MASSACDKLQENATVAAKHARRAHAPAPALAWRSAWRRTYKASPCAVKAAWSPFPAIAWFPPLVQLMSGTTATSRKNNEACSRVEWHISYVQFLLIINLSYISLESLQYKNH